MRLKKALSRRAFLKAGAVSTLGWAVGCVAPRPAQTETMNETAATLPPVSTSSPANTPVPTSTPMPTHTLTPTSTSTPTSAPAPTSTAVPTSTVRPSSTARPTQEVRPPNAVEATHTPMPPERPLVARPSRDDLIAHYPQAANSPVSLVQHDGVWDGDQIQEHVVLHMLDAALTQLTGLDDAASAWRVLFDPGEVIGIKVNTISRYATTPQVAYAVAQRLREAGVPAEQIVLFDRSDNELKARGYTINVDGSGVRCRGVRGWEEPVTVAGTTQRIHDVMLSCDALINLAALKQHGISGFTSAMKNHYGTIDAPGRLHRGQCDPGIPELNALPVLQDKTRLIIGDFIRTCPYNWNRMTRENLIAMSFDPVAHDTVARQLLIDRRTADGRSAEDVTGLSHYMDTAVKMGLGADEEHIEMRHASLA